MLNEPVLVPGSEPELPPLEPVAELAPAPSPNGKRPGLVALAASPGEAPEEAPTWFGKGRFLPLVLGRAAPGKT